MIGLRGFTHRCLDLAARRWPAEIRADLAREWHAELAALEASGDGGAGRRLRFALSLLAAPPVKDPTGAPRGWAEWAPRMPGVRLIALGLLTLFVARTVLLTVALIVDFADLEDVVGVEVTAPVAAVPLLAWCVAAGRWPGRRRRVSFAPLWLLPALLLTVPVDGDGELTLAVLGGLAVWATGATLLGAATGRVSGARATALHVVGVPLTAALAALPWLAVGQGSTPVSVPGVTMMPVGDYLGAWTLLLACSTALTQTYRSAGTAREPAPVVEPGQSALPAAVVVTGAAAITVGVLAWAYTLAILTPAAGATVLLIPEGYDEDGSLSTWVADMRFSAVLLAALGLLIAAADRRSAALGTVVLGGGLFAADAMLIRTATAGAAGLRLALLSGAVAVVAGWILAGRSPQPVTGGSLMARRPDADGAESPPPGPGMVRCRVTVGAVIAAVCLPLQAQGGASTTYAPILHAAQIPVSLALAVAGMLLAAIPAVALSRRPLPWWAALPLIVLPAAAMPAGDGAGLILGLPFAVVVVGLLRHHRARPRFRTAAVWAALTAAAVPAYWVLVLIVILPLSFVADLAFLPEGFAPGLFALVPPALAVTLPAAVWIAGRVDGHPDAAGAPALRPAVSG